MPGICFGVYRVELERLTVADPIEFGEEESCPGVDPVRIVPFNELIDLAESAGVICDCGLGYLLVEMPRGGGFVAGVLCVGRRLGLV